MGAIGKENNDNVKCAERAVQVHTLPYLTARKRVKIYMGINSVYMLLRKPSYKYISMFPDILLWCPYYTVSNDR